jgi:hypothetical protein
MPTKGEIAAAKAAKAAFFKNPVSFALSAVLIPGYTDMTVRQTGGIGRMALVPSEGYTAKRFHGEPIPVYVISDGRQFEDGGFDAYWCPYDNNSVTSVTVRKHANAMFTDRMDGCTFGVGSMSKDGSVLVTHVNQNQFEEPGDTSKMESEQRRLALKEVGPGGRLFEPVNYRRKPGETEKLESTTFGVGNWKTKTWSFYAQLLERGGMGDYILRSVKKIA